MGRHIAAHGWLISQDWTFYDLLSCQAAWKPEVHVSHMAGFVLTDSSHCRYCWVWFVGVCFGVCHRFSAIKRLLMYATDFFYQSFVLVHWKDFCVSNIVHFILLSIILFSLSTYNDT